jgi:hypothetical protein
MTLNLTLTLVESVERSEKLVAEAGESSGTQRRGKSAVGNHYQATASED